jgi:hypothetical protein
MSNIPKEIKQLARWWRTQVEEHAKSDLAEATLDAFEEALASILAEGVSSPFSVSLYYRDVIPSAIISAARRSKLGAIKPHLPTMLFSRAQPGEVYVQIGDRTSCQNIFQP